jgi:outer membrane protein assembly complex protein YaeT
MLALISLAMPAYARRRARDTLDIQNKVRVKRIVFTGVKSIPRWQLRGQMTLARRFFKRRPAYSKRKLRNDIQTLQYFYRQYGFLKSVVETDSVVVDSTRPLRTKAFIFIGVNEGPRTRVNAIDIAGAQAFENRYLRRYIQSTRTDRPLIIPLIEQDRRAIQNRLGDDGYLEAKVEYEIALDSDSLLADVVFRITENEIIQVSDIEIQGTEKVRQRVVRRECAFDAGDTLGRKKMRATVDRLYKTGLFNLAAVRLSEPGDSGSDKATGLRTATVIVEEKDFFGFEIGAGFHTYEMVRGTGQISYGNLFGLGHSVRLHGKMSFVVRKAELGLTIPWIVSLPVNLDASASYRYQREPSYEGTFGETRVGFSGRIVDPLTWYVQHRFEDVNLRKSVDTASLSDTIPDKNTNSVLTGLAWDIRDDILEPKKGMYATADFEFSGIGGTRVNQYNKVQLGLRGYTTFGTPLTFASAVRAGAADPYGGDSTIPIQERFFAGGPSVLRGFWYNKAGPLNDSLAPTGGNAYVTINVLEIRFPVFRMISGAAFFDAGNVWYFKAGSLRKTAAMIDFKDLRYNAGLGVRVKLPVGIIRLDGGLKLDRRADEPVGAIHLDMGQAF